MAERPSEAGAESPSPAWEAVLFDRTGGGKGICSNDRANVYNCLYEYYTDNSWRQKACSPVKELRPYTGSGERTVARAACADGNLTSWRNDVDIDVIDEWDTGEWPYNQADVGCRV